jgi:hypothetical protein
MPAIRVALALVVVGLAAGCGSSHRVSQPSSWVKHANAVCKRDDAAMGDFDTPAMVDGLRREARDLALTGFFNHVPKAEVDVDSAGPLLYKDASVSKANRVLKDARRLAENKGVHCSFGAIDGVPGYTPAAQKALD